MVAMEVPRLLIRTRLQAVTEATEAMMLPIPMMMVWAVPAVLDITAGLQVMTARINTHMAVLAVADTMDMGPEVTAETMTMVLLHSAFRAHLARQARY